jgi:Coenzyme PQQ synthesis protein D (PqqD)
VYRVPNGVRSTHNQDGDIVLDIHHGQLFRLNLTGALIFARLQEGRSQAEIVRAISEELGVAPETAEKDVGEFLQSLEQRHLLCRDGSGKNS